MHGGVVGPHPTSPQAAHQGSWCHTKGCAEVEHPSGVAALLPPQVLKARRDVGSGLKGAGTVTLCPQTPEPPSAHPGRHLG